MNAKYQKYIDYIVDDLQPPYYENMRDSYGLSEKEYPLVLSKVFNEPVTIKGNYVYDANGNEIYYEYSDGYWYKWGYDANGVRNYYENSDGYIEDER